MNTAYVDQNIPTPLLWNGYKWHFLSSAPCGRIFQMRPVWLHALSVIFSVCMQMAAWLQQCVWYVKHFKDGNMDIT